MMNDGTLVEFLLAHPGVEAQVSERGYPYGLLPQKEDRVTSEMPAFTLFMWETKPPHSICAETRRDQASYFPMGAQIDIYADTGLAAFDLSATIGDILDGFSGGVSNHTVASIRKIRTMGIERLPSVLLYHRLLEFSLAVMN